MGSPLGPTLANIFMGFIERKVISNYKVTYFRYVDDCFVLAENEKYIDELFSVVAIAMLIAVKLPLFERRQYFFRT